jgi:hypothetical protein
MSISKLLKSNNFIFFVIALILMGFAVHSLGKRKNTMLDGMLSGNHSEYPTDSDDSEPEELDTPQYQQQASPVQQQASPVQQQASPVQQQASPVQQPAKSSTMTDPKDLLPNDKSGALGNSDLINAGRFISQQSEVLRNANLQIRSDPPVGKATTGPWNGTTIGPDRMRPQFELGGRGGTESVHGFSNQCPLWMSSTVNASNSAILPPKHSPVSSE